MRIHARAPQISSLAEARESKTCDPKLLILLRVGVLSLFSLAFVGSSAFTTGSSKELISTNRTFDDLPPQLSQKLFMLASHCRRFLSTAQCRQHLLSRLFTKSDVHTRNIHTSPSARLSSTRIGPHVHQRCMARSYNPA